MNGLDYGSRIPPLLRTQIRAVAWTAAGWTLGLPRNPHRYGLVFTTSNVGAGLWQFSETIPTVNAGFGLNAYLHNPWKVTYCDVGDLVWYPMWVWNAGGFNIAHIVYELTLPKDAWETILRQGLLLGHPG